MNSTAMDIKKPHRRRAFSRADRTTLTAFVGIPLFFHLLLVWVPAFLTIVLSFTYWSGISISRIKWAGFANYKNIFFDTPAFWEAIQNNVIWLVWFAGIATPLGILLAYQIDRQIRGHKFYETAYYLPVVLSLAVTGIIWNFLLRPDGFVNGLFGRDIDNAISFFGNYDINIYVILTIASWRHIGYIMLLYLAGLNAFDSSLREASAIDGATEWQTFRKIIFPTMRPVNVIILVITIIDSLRAFDLVYIIYGTSTAWPLLNILAFQNFAGQGISMKGAAYSVIALVLCVVPILVYLRNVFKEDLN